MNAKQKRQLAALIGDDEPRKAGRPVLPLAPDFDGAMAALKPAEAEFVRHVLAGATHAAAYGKAHPAANPMTAASRASEIVQRKLVAHALALGKRAGAVTALAGLAYDVKAADAQLVELIDEARDVEQYSAVANMVRERLRLHKLTDNAPGAVAGAQFTLIIQGAHGEQRTVQPGHVIDVKPMKEADGRDSDSNT